MGITSELMCRNLPDSEPKDTNRVPHKKKKVVAFSNKREIDIKCNHVYAKRSMIGAQFLLQIRARRSRRAFSISFRYSAFTTGAAMR